MSRRGGTTTVILPGDKDEAALRDRKDFLQSRIDCLKDRFPVLQKEFEGKERNLSGVITDLEEKINALREQRKSLDTSIARDRKTLDTEWLELGDLRHRLESLQSDLSAKDADIAARGNIVISDEERVRGKEADADRKLADAAAVLEKANQLSIETDSNLSILSDKQTRLARTEENISVRERESKELVEKLHILEASLDEFKVSLDKRQRDLDASSKQQKDSNRKREADLKERESFVSTQQKNLKKQEADLINREEQVKIGAKANDRVREDLRVKAIELKNANKALERQKVIFEDEKNGR